MAPSCALEKLPWPSECVWITSFKIFEEGFLTVHLTRTTVFSVPPLAFNLYRPAVDRVGSNCFRK